MTWFLFVIGFIIGIIGIFLAAHDDYLTIKDIRLDAETLGYGLMAVGFILAAIMLIANGIVWAVSL